MSIEGKESSVKRILKRAPILIFIVRRLRAAKLELEMIKEEKKTERHHERVEPYYNQLINEAIELPLSESGRYYLSSKKRIGIISDIFLFKTYQDVADIVPINPEEKEDIISTIAMLLIITGSTGLNGEWVSIIKEGSSKRRAMYRIINLCKLKSIPVVFYSIEDPPNYSVFLPIAKRCDYVFTSAVEMIPHYKKDCGHEQVWSLQFGINPLFHNPVGISVDKRRKGVVFAGSWYEEYQERCKDMHAMLKSVIRSNHELLIIDRCYWAQTKEQKFPSEYDNYIIPPIEHSLLQQVQKLFKWALNFNSVKRSYTMFANRVYELQSEGLIQLSNYSAGINTHTPLVFTIHDPNEISRILEGFTEDELYERQVVGIRHAMTGNTSFDRFAEIAEKIGEAIVVTERRIVVVLNGNDPELTRMCERQTYQNMTVVQEAVLKDVYATSDIVAFFGAGMDYGPFYLEDMANGFKYTTCSYITKDAYYNRETLMSGIEHDYVGKIGSKYRTVFWASDFTPEYLLGLPDDAACKNGYSIDRFNYNLVSTTLKDKKKVFKLSVIVPVHNNGYHLYGKAFSSMLRCSIFSDMEIVLVDNGSTDNVSDRFVESLSQRYPNVFSCYLGEEKSTNKWRARKKGLELATSEYLCFMEPESELLGDGYTFLYEACEKENKNLAVGNMLLCSETEDQVFLSELLNSKNGVDVLENNLTELFNLCSTEAIIQSIVFHKSVFEKEADRLEFFEDANRTSCLTRLLMNTNKTATVSTIVMAVDARVTSKA